MNDNNSDSVRSIGSNESETELRADVFEDESAVICPDCGGDLQYQNDVAVVCLDCETEFGHEVMPFDGWQRHYLVRPPENETVSKVIEATDDDAELVTDGGEQTVACYECGAYVPRRQTEDIDVSPPDEYYPDMRALCPDCSGDSEDDDQLVTDGGEETTTTKMPTRDEAIGLWYGKASDNVLQWGLQDAETLLLAMQEELGELTQAYLETTHEDGDQERIFEELDDLGALLLQLDARILRDDDPELATDGGERDSLPLEEFSHTTAPEWALIIADDLDLNRTATTKARQFAETHGLNGDTSRRPRSVASGAVYLAAALHNDKRNQAEVAEVADVSTVTVATCYQEIAEAEGLISDSRPDSEVRTDGGWPTGDPCPECGEIMDVGAVGHPGEEITWQECEDCGIGWGPFTGFVDTDSEDDAQLVTDGGTTHEPITELQSAVVWYHEEGGRVKHEGHADLYPNWVRLGGGIPSWVPRDRVEVVMRA